MQYKFKFNTNETTTIKLHVKLDFTPNPTQTKFLLQQFFRRQT